MVVRTTATATEHVSEVACLAHGDVVEVDRRFHLRYVRLDAEVERRPRCQLADEEQELCDRWSHLKINIQVVFHYTVLWMKVKQVLKQYINFHLTSRSQYQGHTLYMYIC